MVDTEFTNTINPGEIKSPIQMSQIDSEERYDRLESLLGKKKFEELTAYHTAGITVDKDGKQFSFSVPTETLVDVLCGVIEKKEKKIDSLKKDLKAYDKVKICTKAGKCKYKSNSIDSIDVADVISRMMKSHFIILRNSKITKGKYTINDDLLIYMQLVSGMNPTAVFNAMSGVPMMSQCAYCRRIKVLKEEYFPKILQCARNVALEVYGKDKLAYTSHILSMFLQCIIPAHVTNDMVSDAVAAIIVEVSNSSLSSTPEWKDWLEKVKKIDKKTMVSIVDHADSDFAGL